MLPIKSTRAWCGILLSAMLLTTALRVLFPCNSVTLASIGHMTGGVSGSVDVHDGHVSSPSTTFSSLFYLRRVPPREPEHKIAIVIPFIGVQTWKVMHSWSNTWSRYP